MHKDRLGVKETLKKKTKIRSVGAQSHFRGKKKKIKKETKIRSLVAASVTGNKSERPKERDIYRVVYIC